MGLRGARVSPPVVSEIATPSIPSIQTSQTLYFTFTSQARAPIRSCCRLAIYCSDSSLWLSIPPKPCLIDRYHSVARHLGLAIGNQMNQTKQANPGSVVVDALRCAVNIGYQRAS